MGAIATTLRANKFSREGKTIKYIVDLVFSGSYVAGGDALNLCAIAGVKTSKNRGIFSVTIVNSNGYAMAYTRGTDLTNGKVRISTTANTELAAAAYPAGITGAAENWAEIVLEEL